MDEVIHHLAIFVSRLWQIHVFGEGNTRTTAVFFIKYLRTLGFQATNSIFAENAWYFRNALVRANYNDVKNGIHETTKFLELFLRNLLLDELHELHNRSMHISGILESYQKADIEQKKADIGREKVDIEPEKADIRLLPFSTKTNMHVQKMQEAFGKDTVFGRSGVQAVTGLKHARASELLQILSEAGVIVSVKGHGKGKYRFQ